MTVEPALATLLLAGQTRQWILYQPDIAAILNRAGSGPRPIKTACRPGSPNARIGRTKESHRRRTACCSEVGRGGIRPNIDLCGADQRGNFRPLQPAVETHDITLVPDLIKISSVIFAAGDECRQPPLAQGRGEHPPAVDPPALVRVHGRSMHDCIGLRRDKFRAHVAGRTDDLGVRGNPEQFGKAQVLDNPVLSLVGHEGTAEREAFDSCGKSVRFERPGAASPGNPSQQRRPISGLRRKGQIIAARETPQQRKSFSNI